MTRKIERLRRADFRRGRTFNLREGGCFGYDAHFNFFDMEILPTVLIASAAALVGYVLGSIPFAVIVAKRHGVDILHAGSGNPGATNVKRTCGKAVGNLVFFLDMFKGFLAAFLPWIALSPISVVPEQQDAWPHVIAIAQLCGFAGALLGHCFSMFLKFKGGKGVSTTIGGLLGAMPIAVLVGLVVWLAVYFPTRIVAIASMVFGLSLPLTSMILAKAFPQLGYTTIHVGFCLVVAIFIIIMHRSNIARLMRGEENSFRKK